MKSLSIFFTSLVLVITVGASPLEKGEEEVSENTPEASPAEQIFLALDEDKVPMFPETNGIRRVFIDHMTCYDERGQPEKSVIRCEGLSAGRSFFKISEPKLALAIFSSLRKVGLFKKSTISEKDGHTVESLECLQHNLDEVKYTCSAKLKF